MKAQNLIALAAATLFTATGLVALSSPVRTAPVSEINGIRVVNLAPVEVHPGASEMRAALLGEADLSSALLVPALDAHAGAGATLLGAQLAMPYYSFGTQIARASKE
ncbi:MAG: hypothetical protein HOQ10_07930 [Frateuria sp.]|uniref:hypothetical protein n=1 Tax=Frateuria sp. TaxID=2211372 RepID=UPI0017B958E8|nr:hypothetical protein [Frateuria sp.]NUO72629.1 hypothetical protein [Frateuria sp.]NUR23368.1 hypothetical protein [Frateuria sp.]